jgi:Leucine-rich repeat (LRR) protein
MDRLIVVVLIQTFVCWSHGQLCQISAKFVHDRSETLDTVIDCENREFGLGIGYGRFELYDQLWWNGQQANSSLYRLGLDIVFDPNRMSILKFLNIYNFHVNDVLRANTFHNLPELRTLHLERNRIKGIDRDAFNELHSLKTLNLQDNGINDLKWKTFEGLRSLEILKIEENKVNKLNVNLKQLSNLKELWIRGVRITSQQTIESIFVSKNETRPLQIVDIADTHIETNFALQLDYKDKNLVNLSLVNSNITAVRAHLPELKYLNLSLNNIRSEIYLELYNMFSLRVLDLRGNLLRSLRGQFCESCRKLENVYLNNNRIHFVAFDALSHHKRLDLVDLTNNSLVIMRPGIQRFLDLAETIVVDDNPWDCRWLEETYRLPDEIFKKFTYNHVSNQINVRSLGCVVYPDHTTTTEIVVVTDEAIVVEPENFEDQSWIIILPLTLILVVLGCVILTLVMWTNWEWFINFCTETS